MSSVEPHGQAQVIWSSNSIAPSHSSRALLFECSGVNYGVAAELVLEVIELPSLSAVVEAPVWFSGLAVYKSRPVPVIDVGRYFDLRDQATHGVGSQNQLQSRAIVVQLAGSNYLLSADKVLNLGELPADSENFSTVSDNAPALARHRAIERVCHYENKLIALINLSELLRLTKFLRECHVV